MNLPIRPTLGLLILVFALAACGSTADASPSTPANPSTPAEPSAPASVEPDATPVPAADADGTFTIIPDVAVTGPGISVAEAIAAGGGDTIIEAYLVRTVEGDLYVCDELADGATVACGSPMLQVLGLPSDGATWDPANAETTGLLEADGVLYFESSYLYGTVEL